MHYVGIDLHKAHSQICVMDSKGVVVSEQRVATKAERLGEVLGELPDARVLLEASGMSEWAARVIEGLGKHEVIVGDPGFALMYGARNKRVKTDLRDARALAEACRVGTYRKSYRSSDRDMTMRRNVLVRRVLVESRARMINTLKGCLRQLGISVPSGGAEKLVDRVRGIELPEHLLATIEPLLGSMTALNKEIAGCDVALGRLAKESTMPALLLTAPGIGPVTATMFASVIGDASRFHDAHQVDAYIGLVPSEHSSGERQVRGRITKAGNSYLRALLIQAAVRLLRCRPPEARQLWEWAQKIGERRGKKIARVALARRLAGVLFAMMRDKNPYVPMRTPAVATAA